MTAILAANQNIQVFVRCRPLNSHERGPAVDVIPDKREVRVQSPIPNQPPKDFFFDHVFPSETKQLDVYNRVVCPLINQVLLGFNCTVFAYGQTGTGKTYTMEGNRTSQNFDWERDPHCGVIPRAVSQLFEILGKSDHDFSIKVSFLELYNEDTYDLLSKRAIDDLTKLKIYDDVNSRGSVIVGGLEEVTVHSKSDIFEILKKGSSKRQTATTLLNACSSRSHTIFSIVVQLKETSLDGEDIFKIGKLNLVDLAGSENIGRSGAQDKRAREAGNINQSLLTLGRVITALVEKRPHVPYRESKLTRLLQDALGGKTKTSIIATVSPAVTDLDDTISTLEYAARAKKITNKPEINHCINKKRNFLPDYENEIQTLMDKHSSELTELEFKIRNEVAQEFKRSFEIFKERFSSDTSALKDHYEAKLQEASAIINDLELKNNELDECLQKSVNDNEKLKELISSNQKDNDEKIIELQSKIEEHKVTIRRYSQKESELEKKIAEYEDAIMKQKQTERRLKIEIEQSEYRAELLKEFETKLSAANLEIKALKDELKTKIQEEEEEREQTDESPQANKPKLARVRKGPPLEINGDYANMTFDDGDELTHVSAKKTKPKIAAKRKRMIPPGIELSGKKKKIENNQEIDLSPIVKLTGRVTRSRATRRKLEY